MSWTIEYKSFNGKQWTVERITLIADSQNEAIKKADKWPGIIIKVQRDEER